MEFRLAIALGRTRKQLLSELTMAEWTQWVAYFRYEDKRAAQRARA